MVWLGENDGRPAVVMGGFRSPKQMFIMFLCSIDPASVVMVSKEQNGNATYFTETGLKSGMKNLKENEPMRLASGSVHLQHDNASCHTAVKICHFSALFEVEQASTH